MPGKPIQAAMEAKLRFLASTECDPPDDGGEATALDYVCMRIESGATIARVARELGVSRSLLSRYLHQGFEGSEDRLARARDTQSDALVDEATELARGEAGQLVTREDIAAAKLAVDHLTWRAGRQSRGRWGEDKGAQVSISLPGLYLAAMQQAKAVIQGRQPSTLPDEVVDVEVVEPQQLTDRGSYKED